jgi:hypothetical protein
VIERAVLVSRGSLLRVDEVLGDVDTSSRTHQPEGRVIPPKPEVIPEIEWKRRERQNLLAA